jgi:hypothetical protein
MKFWTWKKNRIDDVNSIGSSIAGDSLPAQQAKQNCGGSLRVYRLQEQIEAMSELEARE